MNKKENINVNKRKANNFLSIFKSKFDKNIPARKTFDIPKGIISR